MFISTSQIIERIKKISFYLLGALFVFGILTSISFNISNRTKSGKFSKAGDTFGILFGILIGIFFLGVIFVFRQAIGEFFWGIGSSLSSSISGNNNQSRYIVFILFVITLLTTSITTAYFAIKSMHNNLKNKGKLFKMHNFENIMQSVGIMLLIQLSIITITILYQLILREVRNKLKIENNEAITSKPIPQSGITSWKKLSNGVKQGKFKPLH